MSKKFKSWWIIGLILPFIGLPILIFNKKMDKVSKSSLLTGTIIGAGVWIFVALSFLIKVSAPVSYEEKEYLISEWLVDTAKDEYVVTVVGLTTCAHCQEYKPKIEYLAEEYGFNLYFFESDILSSEDEGTLMNTYEFTTYEGYVPFTFITKNGKVIDETTGFENRTKTIDFLKKNQVIK